MLKICRTCQQEFPLGQFYIKGFRNGIPRYDPSCKICKRIANETNRKRNRLKINAQIRAKNAANPEPHRTKCREFRRKYKDAINASIQADRLANPEKYRKREHLWRMKNVAKLSRKSVEFHRKYPHITKLKQQRHRDRDPERYRAKQRRRYLQNTAKICIQHAAYRQRHPGVIKTQHDRRRAMKANALRNDFTAAQEATVIASKHGVCDYCWHYHPDCQTCKKGTHVLTIDHITSFHNNGDNTLWNVTACCRSCNSKKGTRPAPVPVQPLLL